MHIKAQETNLNEPQITKHQHFSLKYYFIRGCFHEKTKLANCWNCTEKSPNNISKVILVFDDDAKLVIKFEKLKIQGDKLLLCAQCKKT